ncbi:MAG TPA: TM0106 family RecB-like putative nuclease [Propionibacteriaceae bacterium]|nr:TM0106 family RecB-like putative nuclease [Propionibacteriaceae bacterium]
MTDLLAASEPVRPQTRPIVLDAYAARSCPVKTHNRFDATLPDIRGASRLGGTRSAPDENTADEHLLELFAGGKAFEVEMLGRIAAGASGVVDLRSPGEEFSREPIDLATRTAATADAVASGAAVILGPALPLDLAGHRSGRPDLLVRGAARDDGGPGYLPVEVKRHRVMETFTGSGAAVRLSTLDRPLPDQALDLPEWTIKSSRDGDLLQMAHYWRELDAAGWASAGAPVAGLIGTDQLPGAGEYGISWIDLRVKMLRTFSRTSPDGWRLRSPLERYDHEFGFRVKVAQVAQQRIGAVDDPAPMVTPIVVRECDHCLWWSVCDPQLPEDDLSLRISKSPLDVREIASLRALGIETISDLAGADIDDLLVRYLPEVRHRDGAEGRLRLAARRANLMVSGVDLERVSDGPIELPASRLEIDLDIETTSDDRVYLWGFLVDDGGSEPRYVEFSRFDDLDPAAEVELARAALTWLDDLLAGVPDGLVFHYSDFEPVHIGRLAARSRDPEFVALGRRVNARTVDLFTTVRQNYFGANGLGLKVVARSGPGFDWRDGEAGGLNSQRWFAEAIGTGDDGVRNAARRRVLEYNEDDVRATHALRAWMRRG